MQKTPGDKNNVLDTIKIHHKIRPPPPEHGIVQKITPARPINFKHRARRSNRFPFCHVVYA